MPVIKKRICIVEDKKDLREGMNMMLQLSENYELVGSYANAEEAMEKIPGILPDAVLMDINLPGASGITCVTVLKTRFPGMLF